MITTEKTIKSLRIFFRITNIAFNTVNAMVDAFGGKPTVSTMQSLHALALKEIEKEEPNMEFIEHLVGLMEVEAEKNKTDQC